MSFDENGFDCPQPSGNWRMKTFFQLSDNHAWSVANRDCHRLQLLSHFKCAHHNAMIVDGHFD